MTVSVAVAMSSAGFIVNVMIGVIPDRALAAVFEVGFLTIYRISALICLSAGFGSAITPLTWIRASRALTAAYTAGIPRFPELVRVLREPRDDSHNVVAADA